MISIAVVSPDWLEFLVIEGEEWKAVHQAQIWLNVLGSLLNNLQYIQALSDYGRPVDDYRMRTTKTFTGDDVRDAQSDVDRATEQVLLAKARLLKKRTNTAQCRFFPESRVPCLEAFLACPPVWAKQTQEHAVLGLEYMQRSKNQ